MTATEHEQIQISIGMHSSLWKCQEAFVEIVHVLFRIESMEDVYFVHQRGSK